MDVFSSLLKSTTKVTTNLVNTVANFSASPDGDHSDDTPPPSPDNGSVPAPIPSTSGQPLTQRAEVLSKKALTSAKSLSTAVGRSALTLGCSVMKKSRQLVDSVQKSKLLQDTLDFLDGEENSDDGSPPVATEQVKGRLYGHETAVLKAILALSDDKRNFLRSPPSSVPFDFNMKENLPVALVLLEEDERLQQMRYELVPKLVSEETFWRNYFYRVSLIKQGASVALGDLDQDLADDGLLKKPPPSPAATQTDKASHQPKLYPSLEQEEDPELALELAQLDLSPNSGNQLLSSVDEDEINLELANFETLDM